MDQKKNFTLPILLLVIPPAFALLELYLLVTFNPTGNSSSLHQAILGLPELISGPVLSSIAFLIIFGIPLTVLLGPPSMIIGIILLIIRLKGRKNAKN